MGRAGNSNYPIVPKFYIYLDSDKNSSGEIILSLFKEFPLYSKESNKNMGCFPRVFISKMVLTKAISFILK
jgi:hypothetical protein